MSELRQWQNKANSESKTRKLAETKVGKLERKIRAVLEDNQRLEHHVQDWKLVAEWCERRKLELDQAMRKILVCLEEIESEPNT